MPSDRIAPYESPNRPVRAFFVVQPGDVRLRIGAARLPQLSLTLMKVFEGKGEGFGEGRGTFLQKGSPSLPKNSYRNLGTRK